MPDWLVEEGIGEDRAIRLDGAHIAAAMLSWHGDLKAGQVAEAILVSRPGGSKRGIARFTNGETAVVDKLPGDASEGAAIRLEVTRSAIFEDRRSKQAQACPTDKPLRPAPSLAEQLRAEGHAVTIVRRFPECDWEELLGEALDRGVEFAGGMLHFSPTPAMTLIDIDTNVPDQPTVMAAIQTLARAIQRFGLTGSIGIDFPTIRSKALRRTVDETLAQELADWPHERTAMNGFGFVQIVARLARPSILHLFSFRPRRASLHRLLRSAERLDGPGAIALRLNRHIHNRHLDPKLIDELRRRTGRIVEIRVEEGIDLAAQHAQLIAYDR